MQGRLVLVALCSFLAVCSSLAAEVFSVVSHPGEYAENMENISWASDVQGTYVLYTRAKDVNFQHARKLYPLQEELCTTYDSIFSKSPEGKDFYEYPHFIKCGALLNDLNKDTEYIYYICKTEGQQVVRLSTLHRFKTAGAAEWSATIISDFHSYTPLGKRLVSAMDMVNKTLAFDPSTDWVLHLGDVVAWGGSYSFWRRMYEEKPFENFSWTGLNGNHDNMTRKYYLSGDFFRDANYVPRNGYQGEEGVCYYFQYGEVLFVMLNNEMMRQSAQLEAAQQWVKKVVLNARSGRHAPRYVVVCEHYQWFFGESGKTSQYARWSQLFDELGVDLALSGNNHIYARTNALYQGKTTDGSKGTVYIQTPSSDNERGQAAKEWTDNKDLIQKIWTEGPKTIGAMNMKVNKKRILLTLLDRNGNIVDEVSVMCKV